MRGLNGIDNVELLCGQEAEEFGSLDKTCQEQPTTESENIACCVETNV